LLEEFKEVRIQEKKIRNLTKKEVKYTKIVEKEKTCHARRYTKLYST